MFNRLLKKNLQDQDDELFHLRQLVAQFDRGRLSIALDAEYRITAVNDAFARVLGYPQSTCKVACWVKSFPLTSRTCPAFAIFTQRLSALNR